MKLSPDQLDHEIAILADGEAVAAKEIDQIIFAWGAWCGTDEAEIRKMLGVVSIFGRLMRSAIQHSEDSDRPRRASLAECYPTECHEAVNAVRATLSDTERKVMDSRYRYRASVRDVMKRHRVGPGVYYQAIRKIRREVSRNILIA